MISKSKFIIMFFLFVISLFINLYLIYDLTIDYDNQNIELNNCIKEKDRYFKIIEDLLEKK